MKARNRIAWLFSIAIFAHAGWPSLAFAQHGRYLRDPPASNVVGSWGNFKPTAFDMKVTVGKNTFGTIDFDYDTFLRPGARPNGGGAALSGGFYLSNNWKVGNGLTLEWAQVVTATITGTDPAQNFKLPAKNAGAYPDADASNAANPLGFAPVYPFTTTSLNPPNGVPAPFLGFRDASSRNFSDGNQSWLAELALVAVAAPDAKGVTTVDVIDTFDWGFNLTAAPNSIKSLSPFGLGPPSAEFLATENSFYSGMSPNVGGNTGVVTPKYHFVYDPDVLSAAVPEPSSWVMAAIGTGVVLVVAGKTRGRKLGRDQE
jgi:hypothetical protein